MTRALPLILVEDIRLLRDSITTMLRAQGLKVIAAVRSGEEAIRQILRLQPRLVLVDSELTNHDGPELVQCVTTSAPGVRVVVMDVQPAQDDILDFVRAGAAGFLLKDATAAEIVATLRDVESGLYVLPPKLAGLLFESVASQSARSRRDNPPTGRLTHREHEVIGLIADGCSNKEISTRLHLSVHTVKSHVHSVLEKLELHSRLQVAAHARSTPHAAAADARREPLAARNA